MNNPQTLYLIGLFLVMLYIVTGFDDFIWDIVTLFRRRRQRETHLAMEILDAKPPKLIALVVAAWHEEGVLYDVIENIIASAQYPLAMYHIFLGIYPNDGPTIAVAEALKDKYPHVHPVVNCLPGPTSKAQNINCVIAGIKAFEREKNWRFAAITIHDSEDVVHPYELKVTNHLIDDHPALQFPVFPLIKKPTLDNFFKNITTNTYVDEFAENHFITMVSRQKSGAFVPSAGTGFSLSRDTVEALGDEVLPEGSITEDYRLSLTLYQKGLSLLYVLERVQRVNARGKPVWEYIATRSLFPNTFKTAVKQKTRWTLGITMQSYRFKDIFKFDIPLAGRYSLYRDQKAKVGNLLSAVGYPVLVYFILSFFMPLTAIYPAYSLSWYLSLVVTVMMLERQLFRGVSLYNIYGMRSVFFGILFPPLVPLRIIWGNMINLVATGKAFWQYWGFNPRHRARVKSVETLQSEEYNARRTISEENREIISLGKRQTAEILELGEIPSHSPSQKESPEEKRFIWSKTDHSFLSPDILKRFHRRLGDVLLEKNHIEVKEVQAYLKDKDPSLSLGAHLIQKGSLSEEQLMEAVAQIKRVPFLREASLPFYDLAPFASNFDLKELYQLKVFPLMKTPEGYVFVYCDRSPIDAQSFLTKTLKVKLITVLGSWATVQSGLEAIWRGPETQGGKFQSPSPDSTAGIEPLQWILVRNYASLLGMSEMDVAKAMGLIHMGAEEDFADDATG